MPTVTQREATRHGAARRDLIEHFVYLAEEAGLDVAERFFTNAEDSFNDLAQQPKMGAPLTLKHPALANVHKCRVKGLGNHLIFYEPRHGGASIVRVLHAASHWWRLLAYADEACAS